MNDEKYSNRELDGKFDFIKDKLEVIHAQTVKTNGRVNTLEESVDTLSDWKSFTKGALAVLTILVVPILIYIVQLLISK